MGPPERLAQAIEYETAQEIIRSRREEIAMSAANQVQSGRGKLFDMLADLTDDDGAIADFDDLGAFLDDQDL